MNLTMLGTGNALVTECYNTCFALSEGRRCFLVDGGGGSEILHRLKQAGIPVADIHDIFITHKHIDHLLGIIWMVRVICQSINGGDYEGDAYLYGHDEVISLLRSMALALLQPKEIRLLDRRVHLITVSDGEKRSILNREVTFFDIGSTKAKQFGFCMGEGRRKQLVCCGDEPYQPCEEPYAKNCEWLLHEAFCLHAQADIFSPYEKHHSTVRDACMLAEALGARKLLLYHTEDRNIKVRKELYLAEGRQYFSGELYVPDDLETLEID